MAVRRSGERSARTPAVIETAATECPSLASAHHTCARQGLPDARSSLPSPANNGGINLMVGPDAPPYAVNPTTGKRKHVSAIVVLTKQFHQFPGWWLTI